VASGVEVMIWNPKALGGREDSFAEGWSPTQVDLSQVDGDYAELVVQTGFTSGYIEKTGISIDASIYKYLALGLWGDGDYYVELYDGTSWLTAVNEAAPGSYGFKVIDLSAVTSAVITGIRLGVGGGEGKKATYDFYEFLSEQPSFPADLMGLRIHQREGEADFFEGEWYDVSSNPFQEGRCIRIVVDGVKLFAGIIEESNLKTGDIREASGRCFQVKLQKAVESIRFDRREIKGAILDLVELFPEISASRVEPPSEQSCVLLLHLDEGSGSTARDDSGYGNDGSIIGATWVDGKYGKALSFDGVDDQVNCGNDASLMPSDALTILVWVKPASVSADYRAIVDKEYYNLVRYGDDVRFELNLTGASGSYWSQAWAYDILEAGRWCFIACTYDRQRQRLYINGVLKDEVAQTDPITSNTNDLLIGVSWRGYWDGEIDEVVVLNRALTAGEIWEIYSKGPYPVNITKEYVSVPISDILDQLASIASRATGETWRWKLGYGEDLRFRPASKGLPVSTSIQEGVNLLTGVRKARDLYELANHIVVLSGFVLYPCEDLYCEDVDDWTIEWCGQCTAPALKNETPAKEGDYAMMIYDDTLNWWRVARSIPGIDLSKYRGLRLWLKIAGTWSAGTSSDQITIKYGTDDDNCYYKAVNLGVGNNEWAQVDVDLTEGWSVSGSPDKTNVTWIALEAVWPNDLYGNVCWDGWHWYAENLEVEAQDPDSPVDEDRVYVYKDAKLNRLELLQDLADGLLEVMKSAADRILLPVIGSPDLQRGRLVQVSSSSLGLSGTYLIAEAEHLLNRRDGYLTRVLLENPRLSLPVELRRTLERELRLERLGDVEVVL